MLTAAELLALLSIDQPTLRRWRKQGLPSRGSGPKLRFDQEAVAAWLIASGHAQPAPPAERVCTTRAEAAAALGVNLRTLAEWQNDPSFPGKPGSPGRSDGYYPLDQIAAWRRARFADAPGGCDELTQLRVARLRTQVEREQLLLSRELGNVIDSDDVERLLTSTIATAKSVLDQLADRISAGLPGKLGAAVKKRIATEVRRQVADAYDLLAKLSLKEDQADAAA